MTHTVLGLWNNCCGDTVSRIHHCVASLHQLTGSDYLTKCDAAVTVSTHDQQQQQQHLRRHTPCWHVISPAVVAFHHGINQGLTYHSLVVAPLAPIHSFLKMASDYKKKIGFKGTLLLEPKPQVGGCLRARVRKRVRVSVDVCVIMCVCSSGATRAALPCCQHKIARCFFPPAVCLPPLLWSSSPHHPPPPGSPPLSPLTPTSLLKNNTHTHAPTPIGAHQAPV